MKDLQSILGNLTGSGLQTKANFLAMKSGLAELVGVHNQISKTGNPTVRFEFRSLLDAKHGVDFYLRLGTADDFVATLTKMKYIFLNTGVQEDADLLSEIPNLLEEKVNLDRKGKQIPTQSVKMSKEEIKNLLESNPTVALLTDTSDKSKVFELVWGDKNEFAAIVTEVGNKLVGTQFDIVTKTDINGFCKIEKVLEV